MSELYPYSYDNGQRLKTTTYSLNGGTTVTLASNEYDELGRLKTKKVGNSVETTNYSYNIQSHITEINGSKFSENLYYNTNTANLPNFTPCYNGNIAGMKWNIASENLGYQRAYSFDYDNLNRLTGSVYSGINGSGVVSGTLGKYNETLDYQNDKMGNIHGITRFENGAEVENIGLNYLGNQLTKVDNAKSHFVAYGSELFRDYDNHVSIPREYAYDTNGNMLFDANGGVSDIEYNVLNLPEKIHFTAGHKNSYIYDASGQKLRVVNYSSNQMLDIPMGTITPLSTTPTDYTVTTTDYVGNMIYENGALKEILLPEGYYQNGTFYYYQKDHLGNNRVTVNSSGAVVEKSHYYPSGTRFYTESTSNSTAIPYRYNGKEMETMNGLNQMDYGARRRFTWGPIWTGRDMLCEKYYSISTYAYCAGNPVRYIDPNGMDIDISNLTDKEQVAALYAIMQTDAGEKFLMQFLAKGQGIKFTFNGKTHTFMAKSDGKFSNSTLTLKSEAIPNYTEIGNGMSKDVTTYGLTEDLKKDGSREIIDKNYNINKGVNFLVKMDPTEGQSTDDYINTFLHEFYVHLDKDLNRLTDLSNSLNNGTTRVGSKNYRDKVRNMVNSEDADHSNLARGAVSTYQNAANQIDLNRKLGIQLKKYNEDVKEQKNQGY